MHEKLIIARKTKGYTRKKLAEKTGVFVNTLDQIEKGKSPGSVTTWKHIQDELKIKDEDMWKFILNK